MRRILRITSVVILVSGCLSAARGQGMSGGPRGQEDRGMQQDRVVQRMFLVGDAGQLTDGRHPVCDWLKAHVNWDDSSNVLVYLGDNIYPKGMPPEGSAGLEEAQKILDYQLSVVEGKKAKAFFVPGNLDWKAGRPGGWQQVKNEEAYIASLGLPNVDLLPKGGCPGPIAVRVGDKMVLVCMDSQWWLQDDKDRPGVESACDCKDGKSITNALKDIISSYPDKLIVLAMHHPLYTHGEHEGWNFFGNVQDTKSPKYQDLRQQIGEIIKGHSNVIHVAGHDHALQLLQYDSVYYVVSGAGSRDSRVKMGRHSLMAKEEIGFATIELHESGRSEIRFYTADAKDLDQTFYTAAVPPLLPRIDTVAIVRSFPDSVTVVADSEFPAGGIKRWLLGANYRKEWSVPVKVKVFDMTGWTPVERGGGLQTRSLRIVNANGTSYVLRGVKKYVTDAALPVSLQGDAFVKDVVTDGVSASYPYACLSVPPLADAMHVPHATPKLVYVPDDPRLGRFRGDYGNLFAFLEEHEPGNGNKTYNMYDIEILLRKDNDNVIDQQAALRARMLDMFVMDFDRHEDQWRWEENDNGKTKFFSPVPRDRDQVFFINQGVIPYFAGKPWVSPQLQGFRPKARNINTFNHNARNFDRNYLNGLTEKDWRAASEATLTTMTDSLIEAAVKLQPAGLHSYSMNSIITKLKLRRHYFVDEMMEYYRFLSGHVSVYGSDKQELFDVERKGTDSVIVNVYKITKDGAVGRKMYERVFLSGVTKEIRLYGLGGDDQYHVHGEGGGGIVVRIIGGAGNDTYRNEAKAPAGKTRIYDLSTEKNVFEGEGGHLAFLSKDPAVNAVDKLGFKYNILAPLLDISYNPDDGVYLGLQFRYTVQGFHKDPYKQLQTLSVEHSLATKAYAFKYAFEAIHAIGKLDFLAHADVRAPSNTVNFFGFGNETVFDKHEKDGTRYYRARYDSYNFDLQLRKRFGTVFSLAAGPAFEYYSLDSAENFDRFVNQTNVNGLDRTTLYQDKAYAGGRATMIVDDRNDKIQPSRGILWETHFGSYGGLNSVSQEYSRLNTGLAVYTSFNTRATVVIANRVGWGKTFGRYDFYNAQFLGVTENLRGYHKYRFAGDEAAYHNIDLRIKLAQFNTYLFPGSFGLLLFNDVGRVWQHGENSDQWHDGYGGGFWVSPLQKLVFSASYGQGSDGGVALVKLGFQF